MAFIAALACVVANGFFVAAEFALAKVRPSALETLARAGDVRAKHAMELVDRLDAFLSATQLGITLASLALGWLGEPAVASLISPALAALGVTPAVSRGVSLSVAFAAITLLHIVIGELVPKSLALQQPVPIARFSARPLRIFYYVTYPVLYVLNTLSNLLLRAFGLAPANEIEGALSPEELRVIVQASFAGTGLEGTKRELIDRVLRGTDRPVRAIMVPRVDMATLSLADRFDECLERVRRYGFSRYPVTEDGDPDHVVGYIYVKDLLMATAPPRGGIRALKRDVLFVPESRTVGDLLTEFQRSKIPIAIIVDEYGGTSGVVTLEDIVEEIVGDIQDELDVEPQLVRERPDGTIIVDGSLPMDELRLDGLDAPPIEGGDTVGGYIVTKLGRLAHPGDSIRLGRYEATVEDVRRRRVSRIALRLSSSAPPAASTSSPPPEGPGL